MQDQGAHRGRRGRLRVWLALALACAGAGLLWFMRQTHAASPFEGANVVVVLIDALREDRLGLHQGGQATSPFIDELTQRSVRFENATSTAAQTVPSVLSLLSGTYPSRHGNQYFYDTASFRLQEPETLPQVPETLPLMAQIFQARGYRTGAVVTNPWLQEKWGFARGFDRYEFISRARGRIVNQTGLSMIDEWDRQRPFLLYLHYMDVHFPRRPLAPFKKTFTADLPGKNVYVNGEFPGLSDEDRDYSIALYDECVRSMDEVLRELMRGLEQRGVDESTLVVVVADHGDEFGEHGGLGHGRTLYQEMLDVPLLFVHPKLQEHARRIAEPVSLVDVLPTLVELTGGQLPQGLMGRSLAGWISPVEPQLLALPSPLISELGLVKTIRDGDRKLIWFPGEDRVEPYDLREDSGELRPIAQDLPWMTELRAQLQGFLARTQPVAITGQPAEAEPKDSELMKSLEALGYAR